MENSLLTLLLYLLNTFSTMAAENSKLSSWLVNAAIPVMRIGSQTFKGLKPGQVITLTPDQEKVVRAYGFRHRAYLTCLSPNIQKSKEENEAEKQANANPPTVMEQLDTEVEQVEPEVPEETSTVVEEPAVEEAEEEPAEESIASDIQTRAEALTPDTPWQTVQAILKDMMEAEYYDLDILAKIQDMFPTYQKVQKDVELILSKAAQ